MKHSEMREMFQEEVTWLEELTAYEQDLEPIKSPFEAIQMIKDWQDEGYDEIPEGFTKQNGFAVLLALWNEFITPNEEAQKRINHERWEEEVKREHPDWMAFDGYYADGSCLFINPDAISQILMTNNYDEAHRELIAKALMAYHKHYQENI